MRKYIIFMLLFIGCSPIYYQKEIKVSHVLAVTEEGDTLKIPIEAIKPTNIYRIYDNVHSYPRYWNYYHWNGAPTYSPSWNKPNPIPNNSNSNNNSQPVIKPAPSGVNPPPTPVNPGKRGN
tara:strand:- start:318 stop:680 length:363 start_codon:yes stop_codon:yes gene_type:complete